MNALEGIKVGDKIFVGRINYDKRLATVAKVGKLHIASSEGIKYSIQTGRRAGKSSSAWSGSWAAPATEAEVRAYNDAIRKRQLVQDIRSADMLKHEVKTLEAVLDLLK